MPQTTYSASSYSVTDPQKTGKEIPTKKSISHRSSSEASSKGSVCQNSSPTTGNETKILGISTDGSTTTYTFDSFGRIITFPVTENIKSLSMNRAFTVDFASCHLFNSLMASPEETFFLMVLTQFNRNHRNTSLGGQGHHPQSVFPPTPLTILQTSSARRCEFVMRPLKTCCEGSTRLQSEPSCVSVFP
jgi:hypothetical protein